MNRGEKNLAAETGMIAIVDDDESMRTAVRTLVESVGLTVEDFPSAEEFLSSGRSREPACLILDLRMPGMGGLELQRRLVASGCRLPIIFMTAHHSEAERARATAAGAVGFLSKPFSEDALFDAISSSLGIVRERMGNEPLNMARALLGHTRNG